MFGANYTTDNGILNYRSAEEINSAMGRVYGHMGLAVVISMIVSYFVGTSPELLQFFFTGVLKWIVIFAPLAAIFGVSMVLANDPSKGVAQLCLHGFAALMGLSFSMIFAVFAMGSIVSAFMGAAILFAVMSGYGYFTKRSLDSIGKFMIVGLIAIVIASIVNIFIGSTVMQMVISALAIIIFLGLTAYDTQQIREELSTETSDAAEVRGALTLYMDFINLFLNLLQLFGDKKE
jgi:FtsH-binding integral membrane protein